ncbi:MAG: succinylglutamate desuccinylase/aspartoacylase family protein, partial [Lentilitoribacter sp.]
MIKVHNKALNRTIETGRIIGHIEGRKKGPTVIFFGGMHGNENSGVFALHQVLADLQHKKKQINGHIYGITGNLRALEKGQRYCTEDLNRLWTADRIKILETGEVGDLQDEKLEQYEIHQTLR